jgi:hypothetical protein
MTSRNKLENINSSDIFSALDNIHKKVIENINSKEKYFSNVLLPISYKKYESLLAPSIDVTFYKHFLMDIEDNTEYDSVVVESSFTSIEKWLLYFSKACLLYKTQPLPGAHPTERLIYINVPPQVSQKLHENKYYDFNDISDSVKKQILHFNGILKRAPGLEGLVEDVWNSQHIFDAIFDADKIVYDIWSFLSI